MGAALFGMKTILVYCASVRLFETYCTTLPDGKLNRLNLSFTNKDAKYVCVTPDNYYHKVRGYPIDTEVLVTCSCIYVPRDITNRFKNISRIKQCCTSELKSY